MKENSWKLWKPRLRKALGLAATIILPMILGNSNMFNAIWDSVFPPAGYYGGMSVPIVPVSSSGEAQNSEAVVLLLQHAKGSQETIEMLSRVRPSNVSAGSCVQPPLRTIGVTETAAGSSCFLKVDLPPATLFAISAAGNGSANPQENDFLYSRHDGVRKRFGGDLIVKTRNEDRERNIFWLGFALAIGCVGHALGRWRPHSLPVTRQRKPQDNNPRQQTPRAPQGHKRRSNSR